jgi:hypothetical protein
VSEERKRVSVLFPCCFCFCSARADVVDFVPFQATSERQRVHSEVQRVSGELDRQKAASEHAYAEQKRTETEVDWVK